MDLVQKYSEQCYSNKEQVLKEFKQGTGEIVWNEILNYRKHFSYPITCFTTSYELILCRNVLWQSMRVEKAFVNLCLHDKGAIPQCLQNGVWHALYLAQEQEQTLQIPLWIHMAFKQLDLQEQAVAQEILLMDVPLTIRLFLCGFLAKQDQVNVSTLLLMIQHQYAAIELLQEPHFFIQTESEEKDITYAYLAFLQQLELKISQRMVLLKGHKEKQEQEANLTALKECYPQFSDGLLAFYATHRSMQHYYTIQQYSEYCHVCYETARYSLDQLVDFGWYQKQKRGKKFVYFI